MLHARILASAAVCFSSPACLSPSGPACFSHLLARMMATNYSDKTYEDAIDRLMSLQSIASVVRISEQRTQRSKTQADKVRNENVKVTNTYLQRLGITPCDLKKLNVIHVAGTKGKGSTCALTESILRHSGYSTGFLSSPHLMEVRERIRLNGQVISRDLFAHYFFQIWDIYKRSDIPDDGDGCPPRFPSFLKYLVVMSYYVFLKEGVDVAVIEVGLGGRFDCTNVVQYPVVTAITHLGYDHTSILGNTIEEIVWEKAGIIKDHVPVLIVPQCYTESYAVLEEEASKHATNITMVPPLSDYPNPPPIASSDTWADNISLALQLSKTWLDHQALPSNTNVLPSITSVLPSNTTHLNGNTVRADNESALPFKLPDTFLRGIDKCQWPGRNHVIYRGAVNYYLDGAHTPVSIKKCTQWFKSATKNSQRKVLIANTTRDREIAEFLKIIQRDIVLDQIIFCPNIASSNYIIKDCEWPDAMKLAMINTAHDNRQLWSTNYPDIPAFSFSSVEEGVAHIESSGHKTDVLVTGSLHLIGAALQVLHPTFLQDASVKVPDTCSRGL